MSFEKEGINHNIGGYFEIEKITLKEFKQHLSERAIQPLKKMSTVRVSHLGFRLWKSVDKELALDQVKKCTEKPSTDPECVEHLNNLMQSNIDIHKPQWEFQVLEDYSEKSSVVFIKMHHTFTDGVGFV